MLIFGGWVWENIYCAIFTDFQENITHFGISFKRRMNAAVYRILSFTDRFRLQVNEKTAGFKLSAEKAETLKKERKERFDEMIGEYLNSPDIASMEQFMQHGDTSTLGHSENVAWISFLVNEKLHIDADEKLLVEAAILHDFYLYDWHDGKPERRRHGFDHPNIASENAKEYFNAEEDVQNAIRSHMWPLNIKTVPKSKEAVILCAVDKYCALVETFRLSKCLGLK